MSPLSGFLAVIVFFTAILVAYLTKQFQKSKKNSEKVYWKSIEKLLSGKNLSLIYQIPKRYFLKLTTFFQQLVNKMKASMEYKYSLRKQPTFCDATGRVSPRNNIWRRFPFVRTGQLDQSVSQ